jgi:hypothetical protein
MAKQSATKSRCTIWDPKALARLVREVADQTTGGVKGLAEWTEGGQEKIGRATLNRVLFGKRPTISHEVAYRLHQRVLATLGEAGSDRFLAAVTKPGARVRWRRYGEWAARAAAAWAGPGAFWERGVDGTVFAVTGRAARQEARAKFVARLHRRVREGVPEYKGFVEWMRSHHVDGYRQQVAVLRILGPFLAAPESGWIEPAWEDFDETERSRTERRRYIVDLVRREQGLLEQRGTAEHRAEQLAAGVVRRVRPPIRERSPEEADAEHRRANPAEHARVSAALRKPAGRHG